MTSILEQMVSSEKTPSKNKSESKNHNERDSKVRTNMIHLRLNAYELDLIEKTAAKVGAPKATALRMAMLEYCRKHGVM